MEQKKAFIQYISHETRGPLQVAHMGLELHMADLREAEMNDDAINEKFASISSRRRWIGRRLKHVNEIADSCMIAQNNLNDMLTYDKLENGMLSVEKSVVPV